MSSRSQVDVVMEAMRLSKIERAKSGSEKIAKTEFGENIDEYREQVVDTLLILSHILGDVATEDTLRQARVLVLREPLKKLGFSYEPLLDGFLVTLESVSKAQSAKRAKPLSTDELARLYGMSPEAAEALKSGVTIGELIVIQPGLFIIF